MRVFGRRGEESPSEWSALEGVLDTVGGTWPARRGRERWENWSVWTLGEACAGLGVGCGQEQPVRGDPGVSPRGEPLPRAPPAPPRGSPLLGLLLRKPRALATGEGGGVDDRNESEQGPRGCRCKRGARVRRRIGYRDAVVETAS